MDLQSGLPLLLQQFTALLKKNFSLSWRHRKASLLQLLSPLFFMFLLFAIDRAFQARYSSSTADKSVTDPGTLISPPITPCEEKFFVKLPCYDFVWSGNGNPKFQTIVNRIMANNPGRPIPSSKVLSFSNAAEVDDWLLKNPMRCPGALHFTEKNATVIGYGVQTNSTFIQRRGHYEDPTFPFQLPLQLAAEREIARYLIGDPFFSWSFSFKEFAHPAIESFSTVGSIGPSFFLSVVMFNFVIQMGSLVTEKENKLRQAMMMMGLFDSAYWLSWLTWEAVVTLISSLVIVLSGMIFQFDFFLKNNFAIVFLLFFLFELSMTGFAFMLSAFIRESSSSATLGFFGFIISVLTQIVVQAGYPYEHDTSGAFRAVWSFFPPNPFVQGLYVLSQATSTPEDDGVRWSKRKECAPNDEDCYITINDIYMWLLGTFFLWFTLAIYFDNIVPNASGVRKPVFYFLNPRYWMGKGGDKVREGGVCSCAGSVPPQEDITPEDGDVLEEENIVKQQAAEGVVDPNVAVQIRGLSKTYPGALNIGCCSKCKRTTAFNAVKALWVNFAEDQLFCLLGPNGAGKTTVINCVTGITPVTERDALIYGNSIRSSTGMSNIQKLIGVCPQFDILWDALSGEEHLHLFASIKGLPPSSIKSIAEKSLEEVRLTESAKVRSGSYSGGMKRRLSVAISLIGDPKLVVMDEPTTGMDPITRRHVWDIIENAKRGRVVVLTTHSMEEADILSDRIGIMAKGRLRCIGTSIRLKSRFGTGFIANISFHGNNLEQSPAYRDSTSTRNHETVKQFFKNNLDVVPKEENNAYLTYVIPHDREGLLMNFFEQLQDREEEFGISDIQLSLTTLEEVFLNIARQAELETASAEGSLITLTLTSGESVKIPVGARFVGIPGTESDENPRGIMVEVYWEQDDTGALCIAGHSRQVPIPPTVELSAAPALTRRQILRRRPEPVEGIVIDPTQVSTLNCLTGITPVTDGDALIYGHSIRSSAGMPDIQKLTGFCPQFDILWDALSGEEHLQLFASIKGIYPTSINSITQKSLAEVRLTESAKVRAGSYSGGMKRRLSVAISLIGDPKLVIMDEPTTGMDPITRRHVWDIIENAKRGRAILLTTHSMEEADILSDRIGIMAKGRLRCIGTSVRLKSRFGTGFIANISFHGNNVAHSSATSDVTSTRNHEIVKQFFKNNLDVAPKEGNNSYLTYVIPHYKEDLLMSFLEELQDREEEFGISDIHLGLTTLEEVFWNIARQAELETAAADGRFATLTLTSGESFRIPVGERFVGIPGTESDENPRGTMVEVYWEQDETGALCIAGHSRQVPIPPTDELSAPPALTRRRSLRRRSEAD